MQLKRSKPILKLIFYTYPDSPTYTFNNEEFYISNKDKDIVINKRKDLIESISRTYGHNICIVLLQDVVQPEKTISYVAYIAPDSNLEEKLIIEITEATKLYHLK